MRIIAGKYRSRRIKSPPSLQTRPTSDRLRETLFNILAPQIDDVRFLDLCAGSGAVGIEALSRGAAHVTFVDRSRKMCALINENIKSLEIGDDEVNIVCSEALAFLQSLSKRRTNQFHLVFFDPPYADGYEEVMSYLGSAGGFCLANDGTVIVEHHRKRDLNEIFEKLKRVRLLKQGDSCLSFYARVS